MREELKKMFVEEDDYYIGIGGRTAAQGEVLGSQFKTNSNHQF
jgi:hypothetical protein